MNHMLNERIGPRGDNMQVTCSLCDKVDTLDDESFQAKRLKNRQLQLYICDECYERIKRKTNERHATGKFKLYREKDKQNHY